MTKEELTEVLRQHALWVENNDNEEGARANLRGANLRWADMRWADIAGIKVNEDTKF